MRKIVRRSGAEIIKNTTQSSCLCELQNEDGSCFVIFSSVTPEQNYSLREKVKPVIQHQILITGDASHVELFVSRWVAGQCNQVAVWMQNISTCGQYECFLVILDVYDWTCWSWSDSHLLCLLEVVGFVCQEIEKLVSPDAFTGGIIKTLCSLRETCRNKTVSLKHWRESVMDNLARN